MPLILQLMQTLTVLTLSMVIYVMAAPRRARPFPALVYWTALAPLSVYAGAQLFELVAMVAHLPLVLPKLSWADEPLQALAIIGTCGITGLAGTIGLLAFVRACLRGEKRPGSRSYTSPVKAPQTRSIPRRQAPQLPPSRS
jgi:hypothetical protein